MKIVIKIGGSVIATPLDAKRIIGYCSVLKSIKGDGNEIAVVVGGGEVAREFISVASEMGLSNRDKDEVAIMVSRLNARLVASALGDLGSKDIPSTAQEVNSLLGAGKIVVMGGLRPGITTDTVAAIVLESIKSKILIKATDQDGIYDMDPRKNPRAKKLDKLTYRDLRRILGGKTHEPGAHQILDAESIKILEKQEAKMIVTNGLNPENILAASRGAKIGTLVESG